MEFLYSVVILLIAAIVAVPIARRLGFGSVLGYLAAGLIIGPGGLALVGDVEAITQVSELGVVMLLFVIGLELRPARLWVMRRSVLGLGTAQVAVTGTVLCAVLIVLGFDWSVAVVVGFALALSSTAMVLPMLAERELLTSHAGRDAFSVLLFQDIAVIPAVALIPALQAGMPNVSPQELWLSIAAGFGALAVILVGGRYLIRPVFRIVDRAKTPEIFTATTLAIVVGTAALVDAVGLSMSLGAFISGVLLSDSEYRHQLRADIEPFEGLLLGVFFISVGMSANVDLLLTEPGIVAGGVIGLMILKGLLCFALAKLAGQATSEATRFAFTLPQAGEFGFVIFAVAIAAGVVGTEQADLFMLVITLSMIATPLLFWFEETYITPRFETAEAPKYDDVHGDSPVIICGFGRMGQIVGRILLMLKIPFTALDPSAEQVALVRRFGAHAYYGDPTRIEMLRAAGAANAKIIVIAPDDFEQTLKVIDNVKRHFPHLKILARARNRRHVHILMDRGVAYIIRETFYSSLKLTEKTLEELGVEPSRIRHTMQVFEEQDEKMLITQHAFYEDEKQLIQSTKQVAQELEHLLSGDREDS
jgi:glutathione-regulated potassium-efflux system ancillary protein KefC